MEVSHEISFLLSFFTQVHYLVPLNTFKKCWWISTKFELGVEGSEVIKFLQGSLKPDRQEISKLMFFPGSLAGLSCAPCPARINDWHVSTHKPASTHVAVTTLFPSRVGIVAGEDYRGGDQGKRGHIKKTGFIIFTSHITGCSC